MRSRISDRKFLVGFVSLALMGCGSSDRLMPLAVGKKWQYRFRWGVQQEMGQLEVRREIPVAGSQGWELAGPMGVVRIGYVGDRLVSDQMAGAFVTPALPIGMPVGQKALWRGWVETPGGRLPAKASITSAEDKQEIAGKTRKLNRTAVTMKVGGHSIELATWYSAGDGIVLQQQTTDDKLDLSLVRVAGE